MEQDRAHIPSQALENVRYDLHCDALLKLNSVQLFRSSATRLPKDQERQILCI